MAVTKQKKKEPIIVLAVVEFEIQPDEVDETELPSGLRGECVKVKSGIYENRFMGTIVSVGRMVN